jgi:hypothetical protein
MVASINKIAGYRYILAPSRKYEDESMSEYESGTFRCRDCAREFLTKDEADKHYSEHHSHITVGE